MDFNYFDQQYSKYTKPSPHLYVVPTPSRRTCLIDDSIFDEDVYVFIPD